MAIAGLLLVASFSVLLIRTGRGATWALDRRFEPAMGEGLRENAMRAGVEARGAADAQPSA